jgi:hypothetical protein
MKGQFHFQNVALLHWVCLYMPEKESPWVSESIIEIKPALNYYCLGLTQALISIMLSSLSLYPL